MKLEKFPVIAPDGTEYRVTIELIGSTLDYKLHAWFRIDIPTGNRWFNRYRTVFTGSYVEGADFNRDNPDYVLLVERMFTDWAKSIEHNRQATIKLAERKHKQAAALEAFRQWDGKITNLPEVSE